MTEQDTTDDLIDSRLVEAVADYAANPDDPAALFYLGALAAMFGGQEQVTPRTAADLAIAQLQADTVVSPEAHAVLMRLIDALWPQA